MSTPPSKSPLGSAISADLDALRNDVESARLMASEYQQQLAMKSNEVADLKHVFEKTQFDLTHLQTGIAQLREERHHLANQAMRAEALDRRLQTVTQERDRFARQVDELCQARAVESNALAKALEEVESLKKELANARRAARRNDERSTEEKAFIEIPFKEMPPMPKVTPI